MILGSAEVLPATHQDPLVLELSSEIAAVARRDADLTRSLLIFARNQPLDATVLWVNEVVADLRDLLVRTVGSDVMVGSVPSPGLAPVLPTRASWRTAR